MYDKTKFVWERRCSIRFRLSDYTNMRQRTDGSNTSSNAQKSVDTGYFYAKLTTIAPCWGNGGLSCYLIPKA